MEKIFIHPQEICSFQLTTLITMEMTFMILPWMLRIDKGQFQSEVKSNDEDAIFAIGLNGEFTKKTINAKLGLNIEMIDLKALHLNDRDVRFKSKADFDLEFTSMDNFGLNASIQSLDFSFGDTLYNMHPATLDFQNRQQFYRPSPGKLLL